MPKSNVCKRKFEETCLNDDKHFCRTSQLYSNLPGHKMSKEFDEMSSSKINLKRKIDDLESLNSYYMDLDENKKFINKLIQEYYLSCETV